MCYNKIYLISDHLSRTVGRAQQGQMDVCRRERKCYNVGEHYNTAELTFQNCPWQRHTTAPGVSHHLLQHSDLCD